MRTFDSGRWNDARRFKRMSRYEAAVEFILLGDIVRTLRCAGLRVGGAHEERLSELGRHLDDAPRVRVPRPRASAEPDGDGLRFPGWVKQS